MELDTNSVTSFRCCGSCGKTIRMRGETEVVLCTAILDVVEAGFEEVCEHYEERVKNPDQPFSKHF